MKDKIKRYKKLNISERTIQDFGLQWNYYKEWNIYKGDNDNHACKDNLEDIISPLVKPEELKGKLVAEVGSGNGRIINPLLELGAKHIIAVEPSEGFEILLRNTNVRDRDKVTCLKITADKLPAFNSLDFVFCIGVIHHIPECEPVIDAAYHALRESGKIFLELYSKEGNEFYLTLLRPLRFVTTRLPDSILKCLVKLAERLLVIYCALISRWNLPFSDYYPIIKRMTSRGRQLIIFDQLNPAFVKYYTRQEAIDLVTGKFKDIQILHRRKYSWIVAGTKSKK